MRAHMIAVILVALPLAGCGAGFTRLTTYGGELADARTSVDGRNYSLYVHPSDDTILIQRGFGAAMGQAMVEGLTLNAVNMTEPKPVWRRAAEWLTDPAGCVVDDVYPLENISWEAPFTCPDDVDLRALVAAQRDTLREGVPLRPQR